MSSDFLDLGFVLRFCLQKMGAESLDFDLVPSLRFRKELALKMLDLCNPFWHGSIQSAHCSAQQIRLLPLSSLRSGRCFFFVPFALRYTNAWIDLGKQSAIQFDQFRRDPSIDHLVNCEMGVAPSLGYQRSCTGYFRIGQTNEIRNSPQFRFRVFEKEIVMSNKLLLLACCLDYASVVDFPKP